MLPCSNRLEVIVLDENKIKLMTKLSTYENKDGKEDIYLSKYYKTDYVRFQMLKSIVTVTIGYVLLLLMYLLYKMEFLIKNAVVLNYKLMGGYILGFYILIVAVYAIGSAIAYSIKYDSSRKKLARYFRLLKRLERFYNKDETRES